MTQSEEDKAFVEKLKTIGFTNLGYKGKRASGADLAALSEDGSVQQKVCKDKVMIRNIMRGNTDDKRLKSDITEMHQYKLDKERSDWREKKREKVANLKKRYRSRYGHDA